MAVPFVVFFKAVLKVGAQAISLFKGVLKGTWENYLGAFWEQEQRRRGQIGFPLLLRKGKWKVNYGGNPWS